MDWALTEELTVNLEKEIEEGRAEKEKDFVEMGFTGRFKGFWPTLAELL